MITNNFTGGQKRLVRNADHLTAIRALIVQKMLSSSTPQIPFGFHGLLQGFFPFSNFFTKLRKLTND
jgi:hypothetical protein